MIYHGRDPGRWSAPVHRVASRSAHIAVGAGHGRDQARAGDLGPGRGRSLLLGACVRRAGQQRRERRADRALRRADGPARGERRQSWPQATVQTCVVHLIRASMRFVSYGDRKKVAAAVKPIYTAPSQEAAWQALTDFSESDLGVKYPQAAATWERAWERFIPFLDFPPMLRRVISPPLRGRYPLHQQHRVAELPAAQGHQEPRPLPLR